MNPRLIIFALSLAIPCTASTSQTNETDSIVPWSNATLCEWVTRNGNEILHKAQTEEKSTIKASLQEFTNAIVNDSLAHDWETIVPYNIDDWQTIALCNSTDAQKLRKILENSIHAIKAARPDYQETKSAIDLFKDLRTATIMHVRARTNLKAVEESPAEASRRSNKVLGELQEQPLSSAPVEEIRQSASTSQTDIVRPATPFSRKLLRTWIEGRADWIKFEKSREEKEKIEKKLKKLIEDFESGSIMLDWATTLPYSEMDEQELREVFLNLWDKLLSSNNIEDLSTVIHEYECARGNFIYIKNLNRLRSQIKQHSADAA